MFALDTNVLAYAEGVNGPARRSDALRIVSNLPAERVRVPVQVLGELHAVLVRKARWPGDRARAAVLAWHDAFTTVGTSPDILRDGMDLATQHQLGTWDSMILAAAASASCRYLLSEDMQPGFAWRGVTVADPFAPSWKP